MNGLGGRYQTVAATPMNITTTDRKAEYRKFLETNFWQNLSASKRQQVGKCERCGSTHYLQCHHRFYRDDWFQTQPEDLEVLCRPCHEKHHGINQPRPQHRHRNRSKRRMESRRRWQQSKRRWKREKKRRARLAERLRKKGFGYLCEPSKPFKNGMYENNSLSHNNLQRKPSEYA